MITEKEAAWAIPPQGWVRDYIEHAILQTTSPLGYHLATALATLATTCPTDYGMRYAGTMRANFYSLLVGRSGEDQKSTALGIGRDVLFEAAPTLIGEHPGSWEGLVDSLSRQPSQVLVYSEFGKFLSQAQKGYFEPLKALITDLWDATPQQRAKANGQSVRVDNPRLSIMAACSLPYLEKHTEAHDWSGGFMGRWAVIYARRERTDPDPVGDPSRIPALAQGLVARATLPQAAVCVGLDAQAKKLWDEWYYEVERRPFPDTISGAKTRAPTIARKVALLYAWDFGAATGSAPFAIGLDVLEPALRFAELHLRSVAGLADKLAEHPEAATRRTVLESIPDTGATLGQILRTTKMKRRGVVEILDALVLDGSVTRASLAGGDAFFERQVAKAL